METRAWLEKFRNYEVEVNYLNQFTDRGSLTDFGDGWIEITRQNRETFLVPVSAIRLLKVLAPVRDARNTLLRPSQPEPQDVTRPGA